MIRIRWCTYRLCNECISIAIHHSFISISPVLASIQSFAAVLLSAARSSCQSPQCFCLPHDHIVDRCSAFVCRTFLLSIAAVLSSAVQSFNRGAQCFRLTSIMLQSKSLKTFSIIKSLQKKTLKTLRLFKILHRNHPQNGLNFFVLFAFVDMSSSCVFQLSFFRIYKVCFLVYT